MQKSLGLHVVRAHACVHVHMLSYHAACTYLASNRKHYHAVNPLPARLTSCNACEAPHWICQIEGKGGPSQCDWCGYGTPVKSLPGCELEYAPLLLRTHSPHSGPPSDQCAGRYPCLPTCPHAQIVHVWTQPQHQSQRAMKGLGAAWRALQLPPRHAWLQAGAAGLPWTLLGGCNRMGPPCRWLGPTQAGSRRKIGKFFFAQHKEHSRVVCKQVNRVKLSGSKTRLASLHNRLHYVFAYSTVVIKKLLSNVSTNSTQFRLLKGNISFNQGCKQRRSERFTAPKYDINSVF